MDKIGFGDMRFPGTPPVTKKTPEQIQKLVKTVYGYLPEENKENIREMMERKEENVRVSD